MVKKSLLGIDLDNESIKLLEVFESGETACQVIDYPRPQELSETPVKPIQAALKKCLTRTRIANIAISGNDLAYLVVDLPPMEEKEKISALKFKLDTLLPYPVDDAYFNFNRIPGPPLNNKDWYFVVAVCKTYFSTLFNALRKAGLSPAEIIPGAVALKNLSPEVGLGAYSIIYFNKFTTNIVLVKDEKVVFVREVKVGSEELVQSLVGVISQAEGKLEIDQDKAREIIMGFGIPLGLEEYSQAAGLPGEVIIARIRPTLEKMGTEIQRTFDYFKEKTGDQTEFAKSYFTGEASTIKNFVEYFNASLGISVLRLEIPGTSDLVNGPVLAKAIGAAKPGKKEISLLPDRYKHPVNYFLSRLINYTTVSLAYLVLLAILFFLFANHAGLLEKREAAFSRQLVKQGISTDHQLLATGGLAGAVKEMALTNERTDRFILLMGKLHRLTPPEVSLVELSYDRKTNAMQMKGIVVKGQQSRLVNLFISKLQADQFFTDIDLDYLRETNVYSVPTYEFEIKAALRQGEKL